VLPYSIQKSSDCIGSLSLGPNRLLKNDVDSKPPILPLRIADGYSHHARSEAWNSWVFDRFHAFSA
jgi:hypothetical protein